VKIKQNSANARIRILAGRMLAAVGLGLLAILPAQAQIAQVTTVMTNVQTVLTGSR